MISAVLADDHIVVRTGIKMLLDADPDIEVVAEAAEGTEAYSLVARYKPDVLLLDISMPPGQSGLIACEKTAKDFPDTKVVILTMFAEPEYLLYTLRGGAAGYVLKNSTPEQLRQAVHDVANGGSYIHPTMVELLAKHAAGGYTAFTILIMVLCSNLCYRYGVSAIWLFGLERSLRLVFMFLGRCVYEYGR